MDPEWVAALSGVGVIVSQGVASAVGAAINNRRYEALRLDLLKQTADLRIAFMDTVAPLRERLSVIEATHRNCAVARKFREDEG
jgi:hypothetical protein